MMFGKFKNQNVLLKQHKAKLNQINPQFNPRCLPLDTFFWVWLS